MAHTPDEAIAVRVLPAPLLAAIRNLFKGNAPGIGLVGGTALAGFYAGHRRSDDIDLFTSDATAQAMAVAGIKGLASLGAVLADERTSPFFFHALVALDGHTFTAQAIMDANIHRVGQFHVTPSGVSVASLATLSKMKFATLVSRCSEKDLYDLVWIRTHGSWPAVQDLIALGQEIDAGVDAEGLLTSLAMATPKPASCGFAADQGQTNADVLHAVEGLRSSLVQELIDHLESGGATLPAIAPLIRKLRQRARR